MRIGSVCSGIEAASVAWSRSANEFTWFSEIADFPSRLLALKYPKVPNLGDLNDLPQKILSGEVDVPDIVCGGTPCQAFSLTGHKRGLADERGQLTLRYIEVIDACDKMRGKPVTMMWENVEGVLSDKTNAFGCFLAGLAGNDKPYEADKWRSAGVVCGPKRNIAWRVLDAKYFGVPQQRRRLYVLAGGKDFHPECVLFERHFRRGLPEDIHGRELEFNKGNHHFRVFRAYTDCLYSAYGTKWNGNAAAYNGSLYVEQDGRLRRFTPLECERLMGFPDDYTNIDHSRPTQRYQGVGNSWAVPVIRWIGDRLEDYCNFSGLILNPTDSAFGGWQKIAPNAYLFMVKDSVYVREDGVVMNIGDAPEKIVKSCLKEIVSPCPDDKFYLSPTACAGILRRRIERKVCMNPVLEETMKRIAATEANDMIERISRRQPRGRHSIKCEESGLHLEFGRHAC